MTLQYRDGETPPIAAGAVQTPLYRERGGDRLSPAPIKDRQAVDGGDQRLRETVGDCEPDRLERERELLALLSQVVLWVCVSKDAIGLRTNARCE